jgi:hypothetical protein
MPTEREEQNLFPWPWFDLTLGHGSNVHGVEVLQGLLLVRRQLEQGKGSRARDYSADILAAFMRVEPEVQQRRGLWKSLDMNSKISESALPKTKGTVFRLLTHLHR